MMENVFLSIVYPYNFILVINFFILLVSALISYQSYRNYHFLKVKSFKYFSWAFLSITLGYLFKICSSFTIVHKVVLELSEFSVTFFTNLDFFQDLHVLSLIFHKFFILLGFLILFLTLIKSNKKSEVFLTVYLTLMLLLLSIYIDFIFGLSLVVILTLLTTHFYKNQKRNESKSSKLVFAAFILITIGSIIDVPYSFYHPEHIVGELFILFGFLMLLINHLDIKNGKKTNKN